jgi:putative hydrolase of the HAD superfamily
MKIFDLIAFDADDTLWHTERLYREVQAWFSQLLAKHHDPEWIHERFHQIEMDNIQYFGIGIKAFALSLIEAAVELSEGQISGGEIQELVDWAKKMSSSEVELLPEVTEVLSKLSPQYRLMIVTKGDLLDQETKIARSGLEKYFQYIEIVSQKTQKSYEKLLKRYSIEPSRFMMIGNSLRSDILPILELGGSAVYIPYETTWLHEVAEEPHPEQAGYYQLEHLGQLPPLLKHIEQGEK